MIFSLLIIAALPPLLNVVRSRRLTHDALFSMGFLYYWILPILVGMFPSSGAPTDPAYRSWAEMFSDIPTRKLLLYAVSVSAYFWCFRAGDWIAGKYASERGPLFVPKLNFLPLFYWVTFGAALAYAYHIRWAIGMDYVNTGDVIIAKGTLTAISLLQFGLALMLTLRDRRATFIRTISNRWMFGYFIVACTLFAMGQRLHFITSLLLLAVMRGVFFRPYTRTQLLTCGATMAGLGGLAGLVRLGTAVSASGLVINLALEPVFTSFSLVSFLQANVIPWIELPRFLAGDLLNLVPTFILPNKPDLLPDPLKVFWFTSPLGALNSWVSFIINFGLIGTGVMMAATGFGLRWLQLHARTPMVQTQYLMCSAFLVFTFFRDPFSVSLVKNIFEFSLMMPLVCAAMSTWMVWSAGSVLPEGAGDASVPSPR